MIAEIRTARLLLTRMRVEDHADLARMETDPRVMATLGPIRSNAETRARIAMHVAHWETWSFGYWLMRELRTGRFVGRGGLRRLELARESVRVGLDALGLDELVCLHAGDRFQPRIAWSDALRRISL